jgi:hypothetical protein
VIHLERDLMMAIHLLETPKDFENYIVLKIAPVGGGCCCFHHWPETWNSINKFISPCGPIRNEGAALIKKNSDKFVLECHESGPEIIIYLGLGTASILLVKSVVDLVLTMLKSRQKSNSHGNVKFKITSYRYIDASNIDESVMEVNVPLSEESINLINDNIENILLQKRL